VAAGVAFLSEPFTVTIAASFALILAGSLLATWTARAPADAAGTADGAGAVGAAGPAGQGEPAGPEAVSRRRPPRLRSRSSGPASPVR
jgi:hypothetical protein